MQLASVETVVVCVLTICFIAWAVTLLIELAIENLGDSATRRRNIENWQRHPFRNLFTLGLLLSAVASVFALILDTFQNNTGIDIPLLPILASVVVFMVLSLGSGSRD